MAEELQNLTRLVNREMVGETHSRQISGNETEERIVQEISNLKVAIAILEYILVLAQSAT